MSFLSIRFVLFIVVLLILYYTAFKNNQWLLLLCGSLVFYVFASPYYLLFLVPSIISAFFAGLFIEKISLKEEKLSEEISDKNELKSKKKELNKSKKLVLVVALLFNILILVVLKYTGFFMDTIAGIAIAAGGKFVVPEVNFILPLGISFYTFMTVSYLADVYWGVTTAQTDLRKYALYISYFPHITSGPIDSYSDLREDLYNHHDFNLDYFGQGLYRIVVGLFKKLVIAGRLAVYVDEVYSNPSSYAGLTLLTATFFYAFQMYCDFSGYVDIAIGVSKLFGINLTENFNLPYLSKSIPEYWRRWHITLGVWFRTYVFYPVIRSDFSKKISKKLKKNHDKAFASMITTIIGLICVWLLTGLWHGASWHYVMHGVYHGTIIIISTCLAGTYKKWKETLHIADESKIFGAFQIIRTFILVDISYILFRANSIKDAGIIMKGIITKMAINGAQVKAALLPFTGDNTSVAYAIVVFIAMGMLIIAELFDYNGKDFFKNHKYFTCAVMLIMTALFGVFGQSSFLYAAY